CRHTRHVPSVPTRRSSDLQTAAEAMKITAPDLLDMGIIERIVPEIRGGAHHDPFRQAEYLSAEIEKSLAELNPLTAGELIDQRRSEERRVGKHCSTKSPSS